MTMSDASNSIQVAGDGTGAVDSGSGKRRQYDARVETALLTGDAAERAGQILQEPIEEAKRISALALALAEGVIKQQRTLTIQDLRNLQAMALAHMTAFRPSMPGEVSAIRAILNRVGSGSTIMAERITVQHDSHPTSD